MEYKAIVWMLAFTIGLLFWFYCNTKLEIDYKRHPQLIDEATGQKRTPSELLDLAKIINITDDYVNQTSAEERLYDLAYYSNFENPFITIDHTYSRAEDLEAAAGPNVNQTKCNQQLKWILDQLHSYPNYTFITGRLGYELTNYMDSFGKPESGLYSGSLAWLGSYRQCLKSSLNGTKITTKYCIARLRPSWWPEKEKMYPITSLKLGICLPDTCDTRSHQDETNSKELIERLAKWEMNQKFKQGLKFNSLFCLPDEQSPLRQLPLSGRIFALIVGSWLLLVVLASIGYELYRYRRHHRHAVSTAFVAFENSPKLSPNSKEHQQRDQTSQIEKLLEALAIRHSLKLFKTNRFCVKYKLKHRVRVNLGAMDFIKIAMALCVVLGHSGFLAKIYARSLNNRIDMSTGYAGRFALSVARCVDIFFLFFGLLTSYTLLRKFSQRAIASPITWLLVNVGIFFRVAPLFMLIYWYARSVSPYTGDGPWWDYGVDQFSMKGVCLSDPWWKSIPYFGSVGTPPVPTCNLPAWFIVSYTQISLLMPLITYILCQLPTYVLKFVFTAFLALVSAFSVATRLYVQTSVREEAFSLYGGFLSDLMEKFESTGHITTLGRVGVVATGCLLGYLLHQYEQQKIQDWPRWLKRRTTISVSLVGIVAIFVAPMIGHKLYLITRRLVTLNEFVGANLLITLIFPCLISVLVLNAATTYNHIVIVRFLSHSFWHAFNRLGLSIFLVHWEVLFYGMTSYEHAPGYGFFTEVAKMWSFGAAISILLAFGIHILIETPLAELITILMGSFIRKLDAKHPNHHDNQLSAEDYDEQNKPAQVV